MSGRNYLNLYDLIETGDKSTILNCMIKASKLGMSTMITSARDSPITFGEIYSYSYSIGYAVAGIHKDIVIVSIPDNYKEIMSGKDPRTSDEITESFAKLLPKTLDYYSIAYDDLKICGVNLDNTGQEL